MHINCSKCCIESLYYRYTGGKGLISSLLVLSSFPITASFLLCNGNVPVAVSVTSSAAVRVSTTLIFYAVAPAETDFGFRRPTLRELNRISAGTAALQCSLLSRNFIVKEQLAKSPKIIHRDPEIPRNTV